MSKDDYDLGSSRLVLSRQVKFIKEKYFAIHEK